MLEQVKAWGNGQGVSVVDGDIVFSKLFKHKTMEERAAAYGGKIGAYEEMSWGEPMEREEGLT